MEEWEAGGDGNTESTGDRASENSAIESDKDDYESVEGKEGSTESRVEALDSEGEVDGAVNARQNLKEEDIILPTIRSPCAEVAVDEGVDADCESDRPSTSKGSENRTKKKKVKKKKSKTKKSLQKKKKKSAKMEKSDAFIHGQTRKRKKSQPNKRKKIRKLLTEDQLNDETLQALREEQERQKRLGLFQAKPGEENNDKTNTGISFELLEDENDGFSGINYDFAFMDNIEPVPVVEPSMDLLSAASAVLIDHKNSSHAAAPETSVVAMATTPTCVVAMATTPTCVVAMATTPTSAVATATTPTSVVAMAMTPTSVIAKVTPMPASESINRLPAGQTSLEQILASNPLESTPTNLLSSGGSIFGQRCDLTPQVTELLKHATLPSGEQNIFASAIDRLALPSSQSLFPANIQAPTPPSGQSLFSPTITSLVPSSGQASPQISAIPFPSLQFNEATSAMYNSPTTMQGLLPSTSHVGNFKPPQSTVARPAAADVICISSESSDDEQVRKQQQQQQQQLQPQVSAPKPSSETICISSETEGSSDDVIFAGTDDHEIVEEDPDVNNSGMHVNDAMNQPEADGRVLINKNRPPDEPEIYLSPRLARTVKPHQIGGIRFMFDNIVESLEIFKKSKGFGCILAHSMGLGKTLQVISFIDVFLNHTPARTALCVVPVNTLLNWVSEFERWLPGNADKYDRNGERTDSRTFKVRLLSDANKTSEARIRVISSWKEDGGVLLMGYEMFRLLTNQKARKRKKKKPKNAPLGGIIETIDLDEEDRVTEQTSEIFTNLVNPGPDLIVCDEGHRIKNSHASISQALKQIETRRRIVLTGYPLQNNLMEYWCMVDFIRPNFLGTKQEFSNMFERPISNGRCADSTEQDIRFMKSRSYVLHSLLKGFVQRRSHLVLKNSLPPKEEYVLLVRLSSWQKKLYNNFIKIHREQGSGSFCSSLNPIKAFSICCKIWNHPDVLYCAVVQKTREEQQSSNGILDTDLDLPEAVIDKFLKKRKREATEKAEPVFGSDGKLVQSVGLAPFGAEREKGINYEWAMNLLRDYTANKIEFSGKMLILMKIIECSVSQGDKILVFSQSLTTLTLMEEFFAEIDVPNSPNGPQLKRKWRRNESYFRLDGNTSISEREKMIEQFNDKTNKNLHLFLLSTRAGCLGINLVGANRVVIFDISWNPCHDAQAVCRVYRYGQKKKCVIYRLICDQSMEKKIYDRQISKQGMANRVVDELNPIQSLERQDITKLLIYDDEDLPCPEFSECEKVCNDDTLLEACKSYSQWLTKKPFHHESLLMDCKGSRLTKAEKRAAQKGYEQEKRASSSYNYSRPSYSNFYAAAGYPEKTTAESKKAVCLTSNTTASSDRPVANVRPIQSTPHPMQIAGNGTASPDLQIIAHLQRAGIDVRKTIAATDVPLPQASAGPNSKPLVAAGDPFYMIHGSKGLYIGTTTGRIFALRSPSTNEDGASSPLVPGPGGQMLTSRERESQIIKSAFNTMIRRNPAARQPIRNSYMSQQQVPANYPQMGNYGQFPNQDYGSLVSMMTQQNPMATLQNPMSQQNLMMNQQNLMMNQQNSITQQSPMMLQQNQVDQNLMTHQISAMARQQSQTMTQPNPMIFQQQQNNSFFAQQNPSMTQDSNMTTQQNFTPMTQQNQTIGSASTMAPQVAAMKTDLNTLSSLSLPQSNVAPTATVSQEQSLGIPPHLSSLLGYGILPSQNFQTSSQYPTPLGQNFIPPNWPLMQNAGLLQTPPSLMQEISSTTQQMQPQQPTKPGNTSLLDASIIQQIFPTSTSQGSDNALTQQNLIVTQQSGGMTQQNFAPTQVDQTMVNPSAILQNQADGNVSFQTGIMTQQNDLLTQQLATLTDSLAQQNFSQMHQLIQGTQSPN